jgi:hypothetical protein
MHKLAMGLAICFAGMAVSATAQTNTFRVSGNVGIGTTDLCPNARSDDKKGHGNS